MRCKTRMLNTAALAIFALLFTEPEVSGAQDTTSRWPRGRTSAGFGLVSLSAPGDSLDFSGFVARYGLGARFDLTQQLFVEPTVALSFSSVQGIKSRGSGVATSSVEFGTHLGYSLGQWTVGALWETGQRTLEYRATGDIENPAGRHSAVGARAGLRTNQIPGLRSWPGELVFTWKQYSTALNKSETGGATSNIADIDVDGSGLYLSWESNFGGWRQSPNHQTENNSWAHSFSFVFENDAFIDSDTGYTNGIRFVWMGTEGKRARAIRSLTAFGVGSQDAFCNFPVDYANAGRVCWQTFFSIGQTMYTPGSLSETTAQLDDRPYAGLLFATARSQRIDQMRYKARADGSTPFLSLISVSSELLLGVKGPAAGARQTQSLAHWTWSDAAERPAGWSTQLNDEPVGGYTIEAAARLPQFEYCAASGGCSGTQDESRRFDFTPRGELVAMTHLARASVGGVIRLGINMPSAVALDRIPATILKTAPSPMTGMSTDTTGSRKTEAPKWGLIFLSADFRAVARQALIDGGFADQDSGEWGDLREIERESLVREYGGGVQASTGRWTFTVQILHRSNEYRLLTGATPLGYARFVNLTITRGRF